jgi:predicted dehydrogenase
MRWVVVGAGSIGRRHLRNLLARGERDLVAVRREPSALDADLRDVRVVRSITEARTREAIAIVCTPTARHIDDALAALGAGCHVLVEKPLADAVDRVDELRAAATSAGRTIGVAHCFRFHALLKLIRRELASGRIGRPQTAKVWCGQHLADWRPGRDYRETYSARREEGGGVLLDLVHELDYSDWLFGPVTDVSAEARNTGTLEIDVEDVADVVLRADGGAVVSCHLDYLARPATRGGRVDGERGSIAWDLLTGTAEVNDGRTSEPLTLPATWDREDMYRDELTAFADAVRGGAAFPVGVDAGARAVRIALAAKESSSSGRPVAL